MNYVTNIIYWIIVSVQSPINLIINLVGLSKFTLYLDMDWLVAVSVWRTKKEILTMDKLKKIKEQEAQDLANLAIKMGHGKDL